MRFLLRCFWGLPLLVKVGVLVALPLLTINGAVAFFGNSPVFPLSPLCLPAKWAALKLYARHRPSCLLRLGHGELAPIAARAERRHGLPRGLMEAVVEVESGSRAHRISYAGAVGPAQLMPATAELLGVVDPFDPQEAIDAGARYLKQQLDRTRSVELAVASYNAGPGNVAGHVPRNGETEVYVARVMRRLRLLSYRVRWR
jgi:soluble lytic murein transglycosylase-like protein